MDYYKKEKNENNEDDADGYIDKTGNFKESNKKEAVIESEYRPEDLFRTEKEKK